MKGFLIVTGWMIAIVVAIIILSAIITLIFHLINAKKYRYTQFTYYGKFSNSNEQLDISDLKLTNSITNMKGNINE